MSYYCLHVILVQNVDVHNSGGRAGPAGLAAAGPMLFESPKVSAKEARVCSTAQYSNFSNCSPQNY